MFKNHYFSLGALSPHRWLTGVAYLFIFCLGFMSNTTFAQTFDVGANKYTFNGEINAIVKDNTGNTYIGGEFTRVALWSGNGVQFNSTTDVQNTAFPKVAGGQISAVVAIPSGGWYIGGSFTAINGISRNRLARINADGSLHAFDPNMNSFVTALALDGSGNLYAGGAFTTVGGSTSRNYLCKFDNAGTLTTFDPNMNNVVRALALDGSGNLYAGGDFSTVGPTGSTGRNRLCKFDNAGTLTTFDPNMNNTVWSLALDGSGNLYAGGNFTGVGGSTLRNRLCKFDNAGTLTTFDPNMNNIVRALALDGSGNLYAGGDFITVGGSTTRNRLCKFDNAGTLSTSFNPNMNNTVSALALDGSGNLYAGGSFTTVGGSTLRNRLCKFDNAGTLSTSFNPNMNNSIFALALDGSGNLYAGGAFTTVGGSTTRNNLCKFDNAGTLTAFDPNMNGTVYALALDGSSNLYVGGAFTTVGGSTTRNYLCKFDNAGTLTAFDPNMNSIVRALAFDGSNLYAGGQFTTVGGSTARNRLCKFDNAETLTTFDPNMNNIVRALALDGSGNLYAGGQFTTVGGSTARNRLCKFDNAGTLTAFDPYMNGTVLALALDGSGNLYAGGSFTTVGGSTTRNYLCKFDNAGTLTTFDPNMNDSIFALALDGSGNLYAGGAFTTVGGSTTRNYLCKFDNAGTLSTSFNPNINSIVWSLALDGSGNLYVGGAFTSPSPYLAIYATVTTPSATVTATGTLTAFSACAGTASAEQSFTVSGSNLTNNITVTAPAGFEISTVNNSGFATTPITLTQSGGNVSITNIYVRMAATATGTPSGNVTCASSGATDKTVAVSGTANTNPSVVINKSSSSICVGATLTLTASAPLPELAGLAPDIAPVSSDGYAWASSGGTFVSSTGSPGSTGSPISWSSGSSGGVTFTVTATNSNNCSATATATVRVNENPSVSISPLPSSICIGATIELTALSGVDGSAGLSPNINSVSGDDYTWASSGGTFVSNTGSPVSWSSSGAGGFNFTVTATNTNSCSATATASVTVGNGSITAMPPTSICAGATINLTASGGISYSWVHSGGGSFSSSTNPVTFNSSSAGGFGFTVTATVTGGCTATATTSVSVKANPSVVITPSATSVCVGKSINLNASTPLPQSAGLAPFVPLPSDGYAWASSGGTFVSSTGSPGSTGSPISWSSGSSGGVTFTVTATNSNNCSATATATVLVNENPTVSINPPTSSICTGQTLELRASPNADQAGLSPSITPVSSDGYAWASSGGTFNSSAATATFSSSSTGGFGFTVTATNINSCSATATASVTVGNASITAMPPTSICAGATINLTASGGISYSWVHSGGGNFSSTTNPVTFNSSSAGGFGFTVTATVSGGCTATATTSVSVKANPTVSINPATSSICVGKTLNLIASTSPPPSAGLAPGVTILPSDGYAWASSGGGTFISSTNQATFSSSSAGGFGFTVTATNANSCSATATASVTVNANPSVSISPGTSSLCTGQTLELRAGPPNPSSAGLSGVSVSSDSYTWASSGGNFVSSTNPATFSSNIAGGFRFTVTASNSNSCSATATASATVNTKPALSISQSNNQVCAGVSINLTATSGLSNYSWVHSGGTFTSTTNEARFSSGAGGTFTFTVTAGNSTCSNSATTTVLVYGVSSANLSFAPICALGNPLNLSASGGGSYSWRGPNGFKSSSATPSKAKTVAKDEGIYSVTVSSTLGCTSTSTIKVYIGVGKITATSNSTVCKGGTIQLSATAEFGASYKWTKQFSSVTYQGQNPSIPNAQPSNGGVYLVFVTGVNGCVVKEEVLVVVSSRACTSGRLASGEEVEGMEMEVNTYPNPTSKLLTVEVKLAKPSSLNLQLFNATGNTLTEWNLSEESTIHRKEIDLSEYKDGLYLIQAQSKDGKQTKRVMKIE